MLGSGEVPNNSHVLVNLKWSQLKAGTQLSYLARSVLHSTVVGSNLALQLTRSDSGQYTGQ